jgi:23S rRNA-/tRNA-specific pseudouridylate synthase
LLDGKAAEAYTRGMENLAISVIYQDHHLLIVNKPPGVVTHPTYKHMDGTLWDALLEYSERQGKDDWQPPELPDEPEWALAPSAIQEKLRQKRKERLWQEDGLLPRPCLLHRLDKDTSGVVALARTERSRRHLVKQFHEHTIEKRYVAVVQKGSNDWTQPRTLFTVEKQKLDGQKCQIELPAALLPADMFILDGPLQRDPYDRRRCIVGPEGQASSTRIEVLNVEEEFVLLEVQPITGRTHQIRAHLAALGYAIVGDQVYAPLASPESSAAQLARQFLHAYCLELDRYPDNKRSTFVAPLPTDLANWLQQYCPALWQSWSFMERQIMAQARKK